MTMTDPIADMLTRIRNANVAMHDEVSMPSSKLKESLAAVLKSEGYIANFRVEKAKVPAQLLVELKYRSRKLNVIEGLKRVSKPGRRVYAQAGDIPRVLDGLGVAVISTSQGIHSGAECQKRNIGGEVLLYVW